MWKDFFYYSKAERRATFLLLLLIIIIFVTWMGYPHFISRKEKMEESVDSSFKEMEDFFARLDSIVYPKEAHDSYQNKDSHHYVLFDFDPNTVDSFALIRLGIPVYAVRNLLKYRQAGGQFRKVEDLAKVYGLTNKKFIELSPYIRIRTKRDSFVTDIMVDSIKGKNVEEALKYPKRTVVDLNEADTNELKKIPGIGSGIANQIVAYRKRLGGFYEVKQLADLKNITPEIQSWFKVTSTSITKINLNTAGLDKLRSHPYMSFYKAKAIIEHRKKRGRIKSLSELSFYEEFTELDLERLSHYIEFE